MKRNTLILTALLLCLASCQSDYAWVLRENRSHLGPAAIPDELDGRLPVMPPAIQLPDEDAVLYQDAAARVNIKGQSAGLPDDMDLIYLTLFSAPPQLSSLQTELDQRLKLDLQDYGLRIVNRLSYAQAIVNGTIEHFAISRADSVTNIGDALMYSLIIKVQVQIIKGASPRFQEARSVSERFLVIGTNENLSNDVVPYMIAQASQHLSEAIVYGWQTFREGQTEFDYQILGNTNESYSYTNRP